VLHVDTVFNAICGLGVKKVVVNGEGFKLECQVRLVDFTFSGYDKYLHIVGGLRLDFCLNDVHTIEPLGDKGLILHFRNQRPSIFVALLQQQNVFNSPYTLTLTN
jgi:hypothetical protein